MSLVVGNLIQVTFLFMNSIGSTMTYGEKSIICVLIQSLGNLQIIVESPPPPIIFVF